MLVILMCLVIIAAPSALSAVAKDPINTCSEVQWRCRDNSCISVDEKCDGVVDCPDGSDESHSLCSKNPPPSGNCVLPPYPDHGSYETDIPGAEPGQGYPLVNLNVTCQRGYGVVGSASTSCVNGKWQGSVPKCVDRDQVTPGGNALVDLGVRVEKSDLQWHAGIFNTTLDLSMLTYGNVPLGESIVISAAPSVFSAVAKDPINTCSLSEFSCNDGACVSADFLCDGRADCADASDEMACRMSDKMNLLVGGTILNRSKRQSSCRKNQWRCRDNSCISFDQKCDGVVDCPDGSDETHPLCRKISCQSNWFRCTYGACVDGTAPCNGIKECADNSDELLPKCRNETEEIRGRFKCLDGSTILAANHCDGVKDCADGSDETVRACAAKTCPSYLFQCAYGACVDSGSDCNGVNECADGSDESAELCGKLPAATTKPPTNKPPTGNCKLPPYPNHGSYETNIPGAQPGQGYQLVNLNVTCQRGYGVVGSASTYCFNGVWHSSVPKCVRMCQLNPHPSVEYQCQVTGTIVGSRACNKFEPSGTVVSPQCRKPNYYSPTTLTFMRCIDGYWDYIARCSPGLTKNGTNITILIKDTVEITYGQFEYVVPFNSVGNNGINQPNSISVVSNSGFNNDKHPHSSATIITSSSSGFNNGNKPLSSSATIASSSGNEPFSSVTVAGSNSGYYNNDYYNNQFVPVTSGSNDDDVDIDPRFGETDTDKIKNEAKFHINITNSSVYVNMKDGVMFRG